MDFPRARRMRTTHARVAVGMLLSVLAGALPEASAEEAPVRLAADEAWQPFIAPGQPHGGLVTHLVTASFRAAGRSARVEYLPWSQVLSSTARGEYQAIAGIYHTEARAQRFRYSDPFMRFRLGFIARRDFPLREYDTLNELRDSVIGVIQDGAYPDRLFEAGLELHSSPTRTGLVRMLQHGRIDLLADTERLFHHHALEAGLNPDDFIVLAPPLRDEPLHVAAPRERPDAMAIIDQFNRGLRKLKTSGRYIEIRREYGY